MPRRLSLVAVSVGVVAFLVIAGVLVIEAQADRGYDRGCEAVVARERSDHAGDAPFDRAARACQRHADYLERLLSQP